VNAKASNPRRECRRYQGYEYKQNPLPYSKRVKLAFPISGRNPPGIFYLMGNGLTGVAPRTFKRPSPSGMSNFIPFVGRAFLFLRPLVKIKTIFHLQKEKPWKNKRNTS
jgi:hypothetical protein